MISISTLSSCGKQYTSNNSIDPDISNSSSSDVTDYVKIKYDANGGEFRNGKTILEDEVEKSSLLTAPESPSRTGYSFAGWSQSKNSTKLWKFGTDIIENDLTLYAVWNEESAVILSVDGASIDSSTNNIFMVVNQDTDSVSLSNKVVCSSNSTWKLYYDKLGQTEIPTKIAAGMSGSLKNGENVFYVVVTSADGNTVNVYTLTIHRSYIIHFTYSFQAVTLKTESLPSGYETELTYVPDIEGYSFNYWMDVEDHKVTKITPFESMSFYANATPNKYTVTLDANQGEVSIDNKTVTYDSDYSLPVPTRTGYSFAGWYNGSTQLTDIDGKSLNKWKIASDKTLIAKWTVNEYVLSLKNSNEEAGSVSGSGTYAYDSSVTVRASANNGYSFSGWYNSIGTCVSTQSIYTFKMGLSETLTARWDYNDVTLNYVINGEVVHTESYTLDKHITELYQYETEDNFYGWYKSKTFNSYDSKIISTKGLVVDSKNNSYLYGTTLETKFDFRYENSGYTITGYNDSKTQIEIPSSIGSFSTKKINDEVFKNHTEITSVYIPTSVTSIGSSAFSGCSSLESITLPFVGASRNATGSNALFGYIFGTSSYTGGVATKQYYNSSSYQTYYIPSSLKEVIITGGSIISNYAFYNCSSLISIVIPNSVTSIGNSAFYNCSSLTSIVIPNSVTSIGNSAFYNCSSLTSIVIPNSVTSIGDSSFSGCSSLESITLPFIGASRDATGSNALFGYIFGTDSYTGGVATQQRYDIYSSQTYYIPSSLKEVIITDATEMGYGAFSGCSSLTSIVIPNSVTSIGYEAFSGCSSLTSITIPNSVTSIGNSAFKGCSSLTSIAIPNNVTSIGEYAFQGCSSLTSITIPNNVTSIGKYAFYGCSSLTSIVIPNSMISIREYAFYNCSSLTSIVIPNSVTSIGSRAFQGCSSLTTVTFEEGRKLTSIGEYAFTDCSSLTSIVIPNRVTSIGEYAFYGCSSLTSIVIPNSMTSIREYAFYNCSSLTSIVIPNSVTSIGSRAFQGCSSLTIYCEASSKPSGWDSWWNVNDRPKYWAGEWSYVNGVPTPNK